MLPHFELEDADYGTTAGPPILLLSPVSAAAMATAGSLAGATPSIAERDRLRDVHEAARLISWDWDPALDRVQRPYGAALGAATGIHDGATLDSVLRRVAAPFRAAVRQGFRDVAAGGEPCVLQYPLDGARAQACWVETRVSFSPDAAVLQVTTQDITELWRAREALDAARVFWQATLESLPDHVAVLGADGAIVAVNEAWSSFAPAGVRAAVGVGANYLDVCDAAAGGGDADAGLVASGLRAILRGDEEQFVFEYDCATPERALTFSMRASRFRGPGPDRVVVQHEDVTAARRVTADVETQARLLDAVDAAVIATDLGAVVTHWNRGAELLYGWTGEEAVGQRLTSLTVDEHNREASNALRRAAQEEGNAEAELELRSKQGQRVAVYVRSALLRNDRGDPSGLVTVSVDLTERMESERRLRSAESYLRAVTDSMGEGMITLDGEDRLTYMNRAAEGMLGWQRAEIVDRPGGNILCPAPAGPTGSAVQRVDEDVFTCRDGALLPVTYTSSPFTSSEGAVGRVVVFSDITARKAEQERIRRQLESVSAADRVRHALAHDRFCLFAQPIVEIAGGRVVQHELLLRMRGDRGQIIAPGQFLAAAEQSGLITAVDRWVIAEGFRLAARGHAVGLNLSAASLGSTDLFRYVQEQLGRAAVDPSLIAFELTETALLENPAQAQSFLERVSELGCRVALDDFGTGYGGFTYLKRLPVHYLKIDREFVRDLGDNAASRHVVQAVVALARGFGQTTVAEGVEDRATLGILAEMGVDYAQGYALGRPLPIETVFGDCAPSLEAA